MSRRDFMQRMRERTYRRQDAKPAGPWIQLHDFRDIFEREQLYMLVGEVAACFRNNHYLVMLCRPMKTDWGPVERIMVQRCDGGTVRSWADLQAIKNHFYGVSRVGVEVFPAERDKFDVSNVYHIWILPEGFSLPFGTKQDRL